MKILITGGAGYIGSHVAKQLLELTTSELYIIDNLSTGSNDTLETLRGIRSFEFLLIDLKDFGQVKELLDKECFDVILHFAASIVVPESVENPQIFCINK
jgi:UDP-glucose 4-epimerase|tara:strand:- start:1220 stop:1519 length:300 start_codon:yes stop_codon:yes gene_type:complete